MQNNSTNETIEEDVLANLCKDAMNETIDCVVDASSIFDDISIVIGALGILAAIGVWAYKKYQVLNADGKITLDEILDVLDEVEDKAKEVKEQIEVLDKTLDKYKVTELRVMLKEKGLVTKGTKSELIARLEE
tara:strand:- start:536 stop:934 length:399 start_codon:yes stop_codon:yes gene_type:complete